MNANTNPSQQSNYSKWAFYLLGYTLVVILWGAWVRISHSGDGCGDSWPLCLGQIIPEAEHKKTWVEFGHRLSSGLFGILVLWIFIKAFKNYPKNSAARKWASLSLAFTISEALLGAKIVLLGLVTTNDSPLRALFMGLHFVNSLMLVACITLLWSFSQSTTWIRQSLNWKWTSLIPIFVLIGCTGALAALASTLFPAQDLLTGLQADFADNSHYLLKLRGLHPLFGIVLGAGVASFFWQHSQKHEDQLSLRLSALTSIQVVFGIMTLLMKYPVWMKLLHLGNAHLLWIHLVMWLHQKTYAAASPEIVKPVKSSIF